MFGLTQSSNEERFLLIFDIGSASIGVAIVLVHGKKSKPIWVRRFDYGYLSVHDYERYAKTMYATLLDAGMRVTSEGLKEVRNSYSSFSSKHLEIFCILAPPWFFGAVHTGVKSKEKKFTVTNTAIKQLSESGLAGIVESQECLAWQNIVGKPELLELYNDVFKLDGYCVENIERRNTNELTVTSYFSVVPHKVQQHIEEVIEKIFPNHEYTFSTSTRLLAGLKNHLYLSKTTNQSILVETGEEITSISLLKNETLINTTSIPFGTNHILRAIAPRAKTTQEANSALEILLKQDTKLNIENYPKQLKDILSEWHGELVDKIKILCSGVTPPTEVLLVADKKWNVILKEALSVSWEMPGIRKGVKSTIRRIEISEENAKEKPTTEEDNRLSVFSYLLGRYTRK